MAPFRGNRSEQRIAAVKMFQQGISQYKIAAVMHVGQPTVHNWLKRAGLTKTKQVVMPTEEPTDEDTGRYRIVHPRIARFVYGNPIHEMEELVS